MAVYFTTSSVRLLALEQERLNPFLHHFAALIEDLQLAFHYAAVGI